MLEYAYWITQTLLAIALFCSVYRVYRGPSVLDRVISVDVILIIVGSVMLTDMAFNRHTDFILFVVVTAVIGFLGAVAIARYVVARAPDATRSGAEADRQAAAVTGEIPEPEAPLSSATGTDTEDESTSWFSALVKSGFTPKGTKDDDVGKDTEGGSR